MVRHSSVEAYDHVDRPVVALGNDYPDGHSIAPHQHRRSQLLYGASGVLMVATRQGSWVVPPQRAMWIPGGMVHEVRMLGAVSTRSLYLEPHAADGLPDRCQVVGISALMRSLMLEAVDLPVGYDLDGRAGALMALLQHELRDLPVLPLSLPLPADPVLAERCRQFLAAPTPHLTIEAWRSALGTSRRAFTRRFRQETGLSFMAWRQQACLFAALPRLIAGEQVTRVALDLGYDNPAAFTTMFRRALGAAPTAYLRQGGDDPAAGGAPTMPAPSAPPPGRAISPASRTRR